MSKQGKKLSVPRELEEIQKEYQQSVSNLGQLKYQVFVLEKEAEKLNERLLVLNNEAAARNKLNEIQKTVEQGA